MFSNKDRKLRCQGAFRQLGFLHIDLSPPLQTLPKALDHLNFAGGESSNVRYEQRSATEQGIGILPQIPENHGSFGGRF